MIKAYLKYFIFIILGLFIQSAFGRAGLYTPDLLLLIVIALAFSMQNSAGVIISFFLGLLSDLASGVYLGPFAAAYVCAFCFAGAVSRRVFADKLFAVMGVTFFACIVKSLVFTLFVKYFVPHAVINYKIYMVEAILTSIASSIVLRIFIGRIFGKTQNRSVSSLSFSRATK